MPYIKLPLEVSKGRLAKTDDLKLSIDDSVSLFLNTPRGSVVMDSSFGFEFAGLRFEIFDENNGTVFNSSLDDRDNPVYRKKISGSSKNLDTFASELSSALEIYEPRLEGIKVNMTYVREKRQIIMVLRGTMAYTGKPYEYRTIINVWSR